MLRISHNGLRTTWQWSRLTVNQTFASTLTTRFPKFPKEPTKSVACFRYSTENSDEPPQPQHPVIPGIHQYGSLSEAGHRNRVTARDATAWQPADNLDVQNVTRKAYIYELIHQQTRTIEEVVPWFLDNMPESYFKQVPEKFRMDHIKAIAAVKDANMDLYLNLQSHLADGRQVLTFIRPGTAAGTLLRMVQELPEKYSTDTPLSRLHVFSTKDESMSLNLFIYGRPRQTSGPMSVEAVKEIGAPILTHAANVQAGIKSGQNNSLAPNPLFEENVLIEYMQKCTETYVRIGCEEPARFLGQMLLVHCVKGTEGTAAAVTESKEPGCFWVDMAVANSVPQVVLENLCRLLYVHHFDVTRARLDIIPMSSSMGDSNTTNGSDSGREDSVTMLRTLVTPCAGFEATPEVFDLLTYELKRMKWLDVSTQDLVFERYPDLGIRRAEIITALCAAVHPVLAKINALAYSNTSIYDKICHPRFIRHATAIADLFLDRFNPKHLMSDADFEERCHGILQSIQSDCEDTMASTVLLKMVETMRCTLKTNIYMPDRYALSMRLDPKCMVAPGEEGKELPYGILFVHGRRFNGFHVRFRDIARGGMRLVTPASAEQLALESARQYDECYGLAFAQQLKNKDIPEGGSKAVILINVEGMADSGKFFVMRKSVKAMTDAILDLIVDTDYTRQNMVDLWKKKEVLYLGPDEQVIPDDIDWIIKRAALRGYGTPAAFMSSKPKAGINHKEYGVTSEGVNVFLGVAIRQVLGIDPTKDSFTVKMTGGPDGDVAGNEIKILIREYGDNVKIVGIADHSGCAEDSDGLNQDELLRLFKAGKSISHFSTAQLGSNGVLHTVNTPEGVKARNSMHNRLEADAFIPCGGRPNTIDITNYRSFLKADGTPSSPLIVEGANLFITAAAREALFKEAGVAIVKDSSANKGGVITSSYEICAAMLLSEKEFFQNKEIIVAEVLQKLRDFAKSEALLLFREYQEYDDLSLPEISKIISDCINITTDALSEALDSLPQSDIDDLLPLFRAHLPQTMAGLAFDQVHDKVPDQYIKNAISKAAASKMVYREGSKFVSTLPKTKLAAMVLRYIKKEKEIAALMETVEQADMDDEKKKLLLRIMEHGGSRTALQLLDE